MENFRVLDIHTQCLMNDNMTQIVSICTLLKDGFEKKEKKKELSFNLLLITLMINPFVLCLGAYGMPRPWYFPFTRSYWCGSNGMNDGVTATPFVNLQVGQRGKYIVELNIMNIPNVVGCGCRVMMAFFICKMTQI